MIPPDDFSTDELRDLAHTWPLYQQIVLPERSTVVIVGAYQGKLMEFMVEAFPQIQELYTYEPAEWAWYRAMERAFKLRQSKLAWLPGSERIVKIFNLGLLADYSTDAHELTMYEWETDAQSLIEQPDRPEKPKGRGNFIGAEAALSMITGPIDLMVMNIEGYEWKLLPWMFDRGMLSRIKGLAVQFHTYALDKVSGPDAMALRPILKDWTYGPPVVDDYPQWVYWRRA